MKKFNEIVTNGKFQYFLFLVVLIVPNMILLTTEPFSVLTKIITLLVPTACYAMLLTASRTPGKTMLFLFPFLFLGAFEIVIIKLFNGSVIAVDMFTNLFTTNPDEAGSLLKSLTGAIVFVCVLYGTSIIWSVYGVAKSVTISVSFRKQLFKKAAIGLSVGIVLIVVQSFANPIFRFYEQIFPINVIQNLCISVSRWVDNGNYAKTSAGFSFEATPRTFDQREVYVLVIGETARAANFSLLGYERETNPELSAIQNLFVGTDFTTVCNATHKIVPLILAPTDIDKFNDIYKQKSIITAFKEAGFKTVFITNQKPNKSFTDAFGREADLLIDITTDGVENGPDGALADRLKEVFAANNDNLFIVLHTYGSHFDFSHRYPKEFAVFTPDNTDVISGETVDQLRNAYDNSIRYTDHVIAKIIEETDSLNAVSSVIYLSDHGEDLYDDDRGRFLHASPTPTYYQLHVPFVCWFSDEYIAQHPDKVKNMNSNRVKPASSVAVFHTMTDIASIQTKYLNERYSMVSDRFDETIRYYINDHYKAVPFFNSGLSKEDFIMLDKKNISYDKEKKINLIY